MIGLFKRNFIRIIQEFLSRFTKHWSLLMLSMLIQFGPFTKKEI